MKTNQETVIRFLVAIFEDPTSFSKSVTIGPLEIILRLPSLKDTNEAQRLIADAVVNKYVKTKKEFNDFKILMKMLLLIESISFNGKVIYDGSRDEPLNTKKAVFLSAMKTAASFKLIRKICKEFEEYYLSLIEEVTNKDFFSDTKM